MPRDDFDLDVRLGTPLVLGPDVPTTSTPPGFGTVWLPPSVPTSIGIDPRFRTCHKTGEPTAAAHYPTIAR